MWNVEGNAEKKHFAFKIGANVFIPINAVRLGQACNMPF